MKEIFGFIVVAAALGAYYFGYRPNLDDLPTRSPFDPAARPIPEAVLRNGERRAAEARAEREALARPGMREEASRPEPVFVEHAPSAATPIRFLYPRSWALIAEEADGFAATPLLLESEDGTSFVHIQPLKPNEFGSDLRFRIDLFVGLVRDHWREEGQVEDKAAIAYFAGRPVTGRELGFASHDGLLSGTIYAMLVMEDESMNSHGALVYTLVPSVPSGTSPHREEVERIVSTLALRPR